jgi:glycine C-acetyltransferase
MTPTPFLFLSLRYTSIRGVSTLTEVINKRLKPELDSIREAGTWKTERIISTSQSSYIKVENSEKELLNFCANNYLGLANNPEIIQSAKQALDKYGAGLSSVRFICGTQTIHKQRKIKFFESKKIFYI